MRHASLLLIALVAACNGGSAAPQPEGPIKVGVASGNNQIVPAARRIRLPDSVGIQAVRLANGSVALRVLDRASDFVLPPRAYAQTSVKSVAGLVACGKAPSDPRHALIPEVQCAMTSAQGKAWFNFLRDTIAGTSVAYVAYTDPITGQTVISDSVKAIVQPLAASDFYALEDPRPSVGDTVDLRARTIGRVTDQYKNVLTSYRIRYRRINFVAGMPDSASAFALSDKTLLDGDKVAIRASDKWLDVAVDSIVHVHAIVVR